MRFPAWQKRRRPRPTAAKHRVNRARRNLLETLEDRRMLATITVTSLSNVQADDGAVTVAEALLAANTDTSVDGSTAGDGADTIVFAPQVTGTLTLTEELSITSEVTIDGPGTDVVTIDGDDQFRIFNISGTTATIRGLTLDNGRAPVGGEERGAGIFSDVTSELVLEDLVISNNTAPGSGAAVFQTDQATVGLTIITSTLSGNTSGDFGGAVSSLSPLTLRRTTVDSNQAVNGGGGIHSTAATIINRSTVSANSTSGVDAYGGGVQVDGAALTVTHSTVSGNSTSGTNADGGGVFINTDLASPALIENSTISGNTAGARGGGVFNTAGAAEIRNSTITNNTANSMMVGGQGGGLAAYSNAQTNATVSSSIIAGNTPNDIDVIGTGNTITSLGYNLVGDGGGVTAFDQVGDMTGVDPLLDALADNGGRSQTHALLEGSPAIDAGDPTFDATSLSTDQRGMGFPRVVGTIDIGSFELGMTAPTITAIANQTTPLDTATSAIPFTIGDSTTPLDSLVVTVVSDNQTIVPDTNIVLGGTGADRTVTITPATGQIGLVTITVTVTDTDSESATEEFTLDVGNTPPTISTIPDQAIDVDGMTSVIPFTIGDGETALDSLVVAATSSNQALVPDANITLAGTGADRTIVVAAATGVVGTADITLTVTDEGGVSASSIFTVTVASPNVPPTITDVADLSTPENTTTAPIAITIGDDTTTPSQLVVTGTSSNTALVPDSNIVVSGLGAGRTVAITPILQQTGTTTITLTVTDEGGATASTSFELTVVGINSPPTISSIDDQSIATNGDAMVGFTVGDVQTFAGSLIVTATSSNEVLVPNENLILGGSLGTRTLTATPNLDQLGTTTITVSVTDEDGMTTTESFELVVSAQSVGGLVFFDNDGDGIQGPTEVGAFDVIVYIDANDNRILDASETFTQTNTLGGYAFTGLLPGDHLIRVAPPGGQIQSSPTQYVGTGFVNEGTGLTHLYEMSLDGIVRPAESPTSARIHDVVVTNAGAIIGIGAFTDSIYSLDRDSGSETLLSASTEDLGFGLAYDPATDTIYTLVVEPGTQDNMRLHTVNPRTGQLSLPIGTGLSGLASVSDLTFDTVNGRIIGFDNSDDQFFQFLPDGTGQSLSIADRPLDSWSLAFNGTTYVMFDREEVTGTQTLEVNPDTGEILTGFNASQRIPTEGLFHAKRGDTPLQINVDRI